MKIARVVGNMVSTIKESTHVGKKLMIVEFLGLDLKPTGRRTIAFDAADAGIGDIVLVNLDGGAAKTMLAHKEVIADYTICGVIDHFTNNGHVVKTT